ncbi:MAG: TolC family protein [Lentisphaeria bacterium]|nr:TolC family protein [Lentisphaeria bacterium]
MNQRISWAAMFAALGLAAISGCTSYEPPPKAVTRSSFTDIPENEQQRLKMTDSKMLTLEDAQNIAVRNNPNFKTKYFAIVAARAAYYGAFSPYLPKIGLNYKIQQSFNEPNNQYSNNMRNGSRTFETGPGATASWLIFDTFVREMNLLAARHSWKQSEALELDARRLLVRSVAYAYNDILLARAKIRIARENMKFQNSQLKENELKFEVGAVPLSNVLNFKAYYNSAESNLYSSQYSLAAAKYSLAQLMGLTEGTIPDDVKFPGDPSPDGEALASLSVYLDTALANRPDLKVYREALEVSKYSYWSSICSFGPTVTFNASLGYNVGQTRTKNYTTGAGDSTGKFETFSFSYGATASWEIFSGGKTFFTMRAAQASMLQSNYSLANTWISIITEVRTAYDNYLTCLKQVKVSQKSLELYRKIRDLVEEEYRAGNTELTRLNEAQRDLVNAETTLATYVINMHNAKAQLDAAVGAY